MAHAPATTMTRSRDGHDFLPCPSPSSKAVMVVASVVPFSLAIAIGRLSVRPPLSRVRTITMVDSLMVATAAVHAVISTLVVFDMPFAAVWTDSSSSS